MVVMICLCVCVYLTSNMSARQKRFAPRAELKDHWEKEKDIGSLYLFAHVSKHSVIFLSSLIKLILNRLWFQGEKRNNISSSLKLFILIKKGQSSSPNRPVLFNLQEEKAFILSNWWSVFSKILHKIWVEIHKKRSKIGPISVLK